jgi:plasmid maintenance system killer protein
LSFLERVNRTAVSPRLLGEAMQLYADMAPEDRSEFEVRAIQLFDFLVDKGFTGRRRSDLALAINFRLTALAKLVRCNHLKGWMLATEEHEVSLLHIDVLKAAAKEALIEDPDDAVAFDVDSFVRRVLRVGQSRGRAWTRFIDAAPTLAALRSPPGNRLEALRADREGQFSIRVNDQWRVCFVWTEAGPDRVEVVDYH